MTGAARRPVCSTILAMRGRALVPILVLAVCRAGAQAPTPGPAPPAPAPENHLGFVIVLPPRLVAGESATLAVLAADGRLAPGSVVEFSGGERVTTDATGRASFTAPAQPGFLLAGVPATGVSASATVISAAANAPPGVRLEQVPRVIARNDRFLVTGSGFSGLADANHVRVGGQPAVALAASAVSMVVLPGPQAGLGQTQVSVESRGGMAAAGTTLVALELSAAKSALAPGERGQLTVRVRGTDQPLELEARNLTPWIVELGGGNPRRLTTRGGAENVSVLELKGVRAGAFSIGVRLVPAAAGVPDIETARKYLLAAAQLAPPGGQRRIEKLAEDLSRDPQDSGKVQIELERMLAEGPAGEFGRLLEAAWRTLLAR